MMWARRKLYPPDWKRTAQAFKESRGLRCERCKIRHGGRRISKRTGKPYIVWLHAAHKYPYDTLNPHPELLCLCPSCHGRYDYWLRMREWAVRIEVLKHRALLQQRFSHAGKRIA